MANGDQGRELAEKVREVICEEWEGAGGSLESAVVYQRLFEEGVEVPNYQMSAILNAFRVGSLITVFLHPQREEEVRIRRLRRVVHEYVHRSEEAMPPLCTCLWRVLKGR